MRLIFMGTPEFAIPSFRKLLESRHEVVAVVTQPDRPVGRGQKVSLRPVKALAQERALPVLQPEKLKGQDFDKELAPYKPDAIIVIAYGKILPPEILQLPKYGCINVHASLLPKYRGAAPVQWSLMAGETETGVTIMQLDEGMDTGPILAQEKVDILDDDDTHSLSDMLSVIGAELLAKTLDEIERRGRVEGRPQDSSKATLAPMLRKEDGVINWARTSVQIICHIRAVTPWPGAVTLLDSGMHLKLLRAEPLWKSEEESLPPNKKLVPGTITGLFKNLGFSVKTLDGHLLVTRAQPENKRVMDGTDLVNGGYVKIGAVLGKAPEPPKKEKANNG
ncbi:MAG: methionyl-tRNA formyltransferase [bacterium]